MEKKTCNKCEIEKPLDAFHKDVYAKDRKCPTCKNCISLKRFGRPHKEKREKYKSLEFDNMKLCTKCDTIKDKKQFYFIKNLNRYRSCCRVCEANFRLKSRFGLSGEELNLIITKKKNNACEICGESNPKNKALALDHNHETNKIRGVLCDNCNVSIGFIKEDVKKLEKMIRYLKKYE